jgi:hypothetical protein
MELRHGNKTASIAHNVGPWDWDENEENVTFDGEECFMAVEDPKTKRWQIYYDVDDDGLQKYIPKGRKRLQITLQRSLIPET